MKDREPPDGRGRTSSGMDDDRIDLDDLRSGSASPEAITEQPDLAFERHPESKWLGDVFGLRMLAVALTWRARQGKSQAPTVPWGPLAVTALLAMAAVVAVAWLVSVVI